MPTDKKFDLFLKQENKENRFEARTLTPGLYVSDFTIVLPKSIPTASAPGLVSTFVPSKYHIVKEEMREMQSVQYTLTGRV